MPSDKKQRRLKRVTNLSDMSLLNNPTIRACLPIEDIPWGRTTVLEKQAYFEKYGRGYVRIRSDSEIKGGNY